MLKPKTIPESPAEDEVEDGSFDHSNSSGSKPTTTDNSASSTTHPGQTKPELVARESKVVALGKMFMILLLLAVTAAAATVVFKFARTEEENEMAAAFEDLAEQILSTYEVNAAKIVDTYETFSVYVSAFAEGTNATWPFVTIPGYEAIAARVFEETGAETMIMSHFVAPEQREEWEKFTMETGWIDEGMNFVGYGEEMERPYVRPYIYSTNRSAPAESLQEGYPFYTPNWQVSPINGISRLSNWDFLVYPYYNDVFDQMVEKNAPMMSEVSNLHQEGVAPRSFITVPIYSKVVENATADMMVASVCSGLAWTKYFTDLPSTQNGNIYMVLSNTCNQTLTYLINGANVTYLGQGDYHNFKYDDLAVETSFSPVAVEMKCMYTISVYPSNNFSDTFLTKKPALYTVTVISIFLFTISVFLLYDCFVEQRQAKVLSTAERSTAIVSSLFPQQVADQLMGEAAERPKTKMPIESPFMNNKMKSSQYGNYDDEPTIKHIAELFPSTTVMFADIVGFTAWSSEREPSQVFELLEHIYSSFDHIAKRKKVFKVETVGDCYMAAAGIPDKRPDHAFLMARFARDCLKKMLHVVRRLESHLGPSTGELGLRIGIHSGPVTAGVLRGDKARFQLFGDTVNTAARMESTGAKNKIQVSAETAALIKQEEKNEREIWVVPREDRVHAKGKGDLVTFWLAYSNMGAGRSCTTESSTGGATIVSTADSNTSEGDSITEMLKDSEEEKRERSIEWTATVLQRLLRQVVAIRGGMAEYTTSFEPPLRDGTKRPLDEVVEMINLNRKQPSVPVDPNSVELPEEILVQLRDYIRKIANMYHANYFHNFEHAIHVTLSVTKLLARVVTPNIDSSDSEQRLHEYTFGITSNPLALFAVAFSALIHDVDHPGVPNSILVAEETENAKFYKNQSVAEQNSVDLAWDLLAEPSYAALRACIYRNQDEYSRFRQLVVNTVMATDIVDKELGAARKARWQKAFALPAASVGITGEDAVNDANRKATIVIEHIIQASDVSHTMQHWHIYVRWNERFFFECYHGYLSGRTSKDPSIDWYESEIGFFDYYVIPLAKKLKDCQVFGVSSEEYLNYAIVNRHEWEAKGRDLVRGYIGKFKKRLVKKCDLNSGAKYC